MARKPDTSKAGQGLRDWVLQTQGIALSESRADGFTRLLAAASSALSAVTPPTLFDTEPENLRVVQNLSTGMSNE